MSQENATALLMEEFGQAWDHYRHVENTRQQMLGFLYTIALACIGGGAGLLKDNVTMERYWATIGMALVVGFLSLIVVVRLAKQTVVLGHYVGAWREVRRHVYAEKFAALNGILDIYENRRVTRFFSTETAMTSWSVWIVAGMSAFYPFLGVVGVWPGPLLVPGHRVLLGALVATMVVTGMLLRIRIRSALREPADPQGRGNAKAT